MSSEAQWSVVSFTGHYPIVYHPNRDSATELGGLWLRLQEQNCPCHAIQLMIAAEIGVDAGLHKGVLLVVCGVEGA